MSTNVKGMRAPDSNDAFQPHVDIKNLRDDIVAALAPTTRTWTYDRGADGTFGAGSYVGLVSGTISAAPAGKYLIAAALVLRGGAVAGGTAQIFAGGSSIFSTLMDVQPSPDPRPIGFVARPYTHAATGNLTIEAGINVGAGTTTVYALGTYVEAFWLGPN